MVKPKYPTKEGNWSLGKRKEESYGEVRLGLPFKEAVENFRKAAQDRDDFDPAVLFVWGTMQGKAVLEILKGVEEAFGEAGQEVVRKAINQVGYRTAEQFLEDSTFPEGIDDIDLTSFIITGINTVLYGSLERPWIATPDRCEFDILWCPHQDIYTAFDCRVQRYFVEGMIQAIEDKGLASFVPVVDKLIPHGGDCCHFFVERRQENDDEHPWHAYSEELGKRALTKMTEKRSEK